MSIEARINFWGFQDDKLIYDERKKRFVHTSDLSRSLQRQYRGNTFKHQRPDLNGQEREEFAIKLRFGQ